MGHYILAFDDACMTSFTRGKVARMNENFLYYKPRLAQYSSRSELRHLLSNYTLYDIPTKHNFFSRVTKLPWEKNMRSGFDAWRIFLIYEKRQRSWAWSGIECGPKQTIDGWIALVTGSNFTKKPKPQMHSFFYERPPNMQKMGFFEVFWGFLTVTSPNFI